MIFSPLYSGSTGNASLIEAGDIRLLLDAGLAGNRIESALNALDVPPSTIRAILITHEHSDHICGAGVLSRRYGIPIYANAACFEAMQGTIGPISPKCIRIFETGRDFYIGDINITPFLIPHDAAEPVGYTFEHDRKRVGILTDVGRMEAHLIDALEGCSLVLLEANHDIDMVRNGPYPYPLKQRILGRKGHLSNADSGLALCKLYARGLRHAILGHLSRHNNTETLAMETVLEVLKSEGVEDMRVALAYSDRPCGVFHL